MRWGFVFFPFGRDGDEITFLIHFGDIQHGHAGQAIAFKRSSNRFAFGGFSFRLPTLLYQEGYD
jgi:hypothetical protein